MKFKAEAFTKNFIVFVAALVIGGPLGNMINSALGQVSGSLIGLIIGYGATFTVYVFASHWFRAKPSFD